MMCTPQNNKKSFSDSFDIVNLLRVVATLFVFILHGRSWVTKLADSDLLRTITCLPAWAGVWIFLFLSGYTVGLGFFKGRYSILNSNNKLSIKKTLLFFWHRFLKIAPFYYCYCFLWELFNGGFFFLHNPKTLFRVLTFSFNGNGGVSGMGHLWYVSTAMQMYLVMPFAYLLIKKIKTAFQTKLDLLLVLVGGLILRLYFRSTGADWYSDVYTASLCNLDLVISGMLIAFYKTHFAPKQHPSKILLCLSILLFFCLTWYNVSIYITSSSTDLLIYRYYLPSCYALISAILIIFWGNIHYRSRPVSLKGLIKSPMSLIDWFAPKTYAFYIFHMTALDYAATIIKDVPVLTALPVQISIFIQYGIAFILALICSCLFSKITFKNKRKEVVSTAIREEST